LDLWRTGVWDLVLMDIQMPVMDGIAAASLVRAAEHREGRARTPIIAVTANAMSHHRDQHMAVGMDDVVAKPINLRLLLQTIARATEPGTCNHVPGVEMVSSATH
jgi:CheY-like chemotaxis protein